MKCVSHIYIMVVKSKYTNMKDIFLGDNINMFLCVSQSERMVFEKMVIAQVTYISCDR